MHSENKLILQANHAFIINLHLNRKRLKGDKTVNPFLALRRSPLSSLTEEVFRSLLRRHSESQVF